MHTESATFEHIPRNRNALHSAITGCCASSLRPASYFPGISDVTHWEEEGGAKKRYAFPPIPPFNLRLEKKGHGTKEESK